MATEQAVEAVPGPWKSKAQVYVICWYSFRKDVPSLAFSPLEAESSFASPESGRPVGGLYSIQIVRYQESPIGTYDELVISPGAFAHPVEAAGKSTEKKNLRITRIYVSSKNSCYNGRHSKPSARLRPF